MMIYFFNDGDNTVTFTANQRNIISVDLNKISLNNDNNFDEDDPDSKPL